MGKCDGNQYKSLNVDVVDVYVGGSVFMSMLVGRCLCRCRMSDVECRMSNIEYGWFMGVDVDVVDGVDVDVVDGVDVDVDVDVDVVDAEFVDMYAVLLLMLMLMTLHDVA